MGVKTVLAVIVAFVAVVFVAITKLNSDPTGADIKIIESAPHVERHLAAYRDKIGADYTAYRNHIYRVLSYANYFLQGDETHREVIEAALVYHDLGLWSDDALAYLEPSTARARKELAKAFNSPEQLQLVEDIIMNHHKVTPFTGSNAKYVEAVRKADWIDATQGLVAQGMPRANIALVSQTIPNAGFHKALLELGPRLRGWNVYRIVTELGSIFRF
eukprot:TRINITY_DN13803_c0_g1_i1.p1 TRINITY_DN13803_c0_g1~~TRINITY_DN13803_c0_g1_i1.p1  ORF type:complete len:217 (-),score=52.23 TRINITY_DN13803_c0_g1_i1:53-703(-)